MSDPIAELLRQIAAKDDELRYLRDRVRRLTVSRDSWRAKARMTPAERKAALEWGRWRHEQRKRAA